MKSKKLILSLFGAALAGLWTAQASAGIIGYVELKHDGLDPAVLSGGGRSEFIVNKYVFGNATDGWTEQNSGLFGDSGAVLYASCIESTETIVVGETRWYAIDNSIVGAPSSGNITANEAALIEKVLSQKFGANFQKPDNSAVDPAAMTALQSLFWDAARFDGLNGATPTPSNEWGQKGAVEALINGLSTTINVDTYALIRVNDYVPASGDPAASFQGSNFNFAPEYGQDFLTYLPKRNPPGSDTPVPVPAPLLLFGTGLLGLYGTLRRRRA